MGGDCYAKGGAVKGAAKEASVMAAFKGAKPMKKADGGRVLAVGDIPGYRNKDTPTMNAQEMRTMQRYRAAMASRPNREPLVSPDIAAIKGALQSATRGAAPPVAAPSPMMGAPAMKKGGKVMKKEDGGAIVADTESDEVAREQAEGVMAQPTTAPPAEASTFGSAFRSARAAGANAFTWRGKRYTTDLAAPTRPKAAAPVRDQVSPAANTVPQKLHNTAYSVRAGMGKELADAATRSKAAAPVRDQVSPAANIVPQKLRNTAYSVRAGMEKELADAKGTPLRVVPRLTKYGVGDAATRGELAAVKAAFKGIKEAVGKADGGRINLPKRTDDESRAFGDLANKILPRAKAPEPAPKSKAVPVASREPMIKPKVTDSMYQGRTSRPDDKVTKGRW